MSGLVSVVFVQKYSLKNGGTALELCLCRTASCDSFFGRKALKHLETADADDLKQAKIIACLVH